MDGTGGPPLCFPNLNSSCRLLLRPTSQTILLYTLLASVSLLTVVLNLLVVVSISHFQQLHTPTNDLLLSLAVSDLLVGLLVMPIEGLRYIKMCWLLGRLMCALSPHLSYCLLSVSLGSMVLMSVDCYIAICDPLLYSSKITVNRVKLSVCVCWACSLLYNGCILMEHIGWQERFSSCHGECVVFISRTSGTVNLFFSFLGPCGVMFILYTRVFMVAVSQVRAIQSQVAVRTAPAAKKSELKAARTLGILIAVFLMCSCPYYYPSFAGDDTSTSLPYYTLLFWMVLTNSGVNPVIYALFYFWFRRAIRLIVTLRILQPHSREVKIL